MTFWSESSPEVLQQKLLVTRPFIFLAFGLYSRDFFQSLVFDWRILSGRRGCRWGGFLFYFVCRYLSFVPILSVVILWSTGVGPMPEGAMSDGSPHQGAHHLCAQVVRYVGEATFLIVNACAYQILSIRVIAVCRIGFIGLMLNLTSITFGGITLYAFSQMKGIFEDPKVPLIIAAYLFVLSTFLLILFVFGVLRSRARGSLSGNNSINEYEGRSALYVLYQEGIFRVISSWIAQAVVSIAVFCQVDPDRILLSCIGLMSSIAIVMCSCRTYKDMVNRSSFCPMYYSPTLLFWAVRRLLRGRGCLPHNHSSSNVDLPQEIQQRRSMSTCPRSRDSQVEVIELEFLEDHTDSKIQLEPPSPTLPRPLPLSHPS